MKIHRARLARSLRVLLLFACTSLNAQVTISGSVSPNNVASPTWTVGGDLIVGYAGTGALTIDSGGTVKATSVTLSRSGSGFSGTLNLNTGGVLETGQLSRGSSTGGVFNWNGGTLRLTGDQSSLFSVFGTERAGFNLYDGIIDTQGYTVTTADNILVIGNYGTLSKTGSGTFVSKLNASQFTLNVDQGTFINRSSLRLATLTSGSSTLNVATHNGDNATFRMDGVDTVGTLRTTAYALNVGTASGATGAVEVVAGAFSMRNNLFVGQYGGNGSFLLDGTGTVSVDWGYFGADGGSGSLTINGGTWTSASQLGFGTGANSSGTLTMTGGTMDVASLQFGTGALGAVSAAYAGTSNGTATITGGTLNAHGNITVGGYGTADFTLSGTGVVNSGFLLLGGWKEIRVTNDGSGGFLTLAVATGSGTVNVNDGTWNNSGDVTLGRQGSGTLNINGGAFSSVNTILGETAYAFQVVGYDGDYRGSGTVNVTGGTWTNSGWISVGNQGDGVINLSGGSMSSAYAALGQKPATTGANHAAAGNGTVNVSGGVWTNTGIFNIGESGVGTVNLTGGTLDVGGLMTLAVNASGSGTLNFGAYDLAHPTAAGTLNASAIAFGAGAGVINFNQNHALTLGTVISGDGAVNQRGSGTTILTGANTYTGLTTVSGGTLQIGNGGTAGSINGDVQNNATLAFNRSDDLAYDGAISGTGIVTQLGTGKLTLTGTHTHTGGTWARAGTLALADGASITHTGANLTIGLYDGDNAAVTLGSGSSVSDQMGVIGWRAGSTGSATVANATWTHADELRIGDEGSGTLTFGGGTISNTYGNIARESGSTGTVTMTAGTWNNSQWLVVGNAGNGSFTQTGGTVNAVNALLGHRAGGVGTATLSDSAWHLSNDLHIGNNGSGTLNLLGGSSVSANHGAGIAYIAAASGVTGTLNFGAYDQSAPTATGTLAASAIIFGEGTGTIHFNQTNTLTLDAAISGNGTLNQRGTGKTILTGASTYTGPTTVEAGTLIVNGSITSDVSVASGATLGGHGTILGNLTVTGSLAPGNSIGTLTVTETLHWHAGATFAFELGAGESDRLLLGGDFLKSGTGEFAFLFQDADWRQNEIYTLVQFDGHTDFIASDFSFLNTGDAFDGYFLINDHSVQFVLTSVPEPAAAMSFFVLLGGGMLIRRRPGKE